MKFMLQAGNWYDQWRMISSAVPEGDRLGFWGFLMPDHYMWGSSRGGDSTLETWTALTFIAARTEKIKLGTLVTPIPFRPPGMLAKQVSTLDIISGGRTILGIGAGWSMTEFEGYSEWNEPKVRVDKTLEGIRLILRLWTSKSKVNESGEYYRAKNAVLEPKPVQKPHPPLLFGGVKKRMLEMAGKYADICCIPPFSSLGYERSKEIVLKAAEKSSRKSKLVFADIFWEFGSYDMQATQRKVLESEKNGSDYFIIRFPKKTYAKSMREFAKNIMHSF